ncbi:3-hydroxybutyryl-CoA dehydratase [Bradyrhizobium sp. USDA 377]
MSHAPLKPGAAFAFRKTMTVAEQAMFTGISGNLGGLYVDAVRAKKAGASNMVAFELAVGGLATTCLSQLGGPTRRIGSIALTFAAPVIVGESVEARAEIVSVDGDDAVCRVTCTLSPSGATVVDGTATLVPFTKG